jgi:hypothetical protein
MGLKARAIAAYLPESSVGPIPQELAPFLKVPWEPKGWLPRLLRAFPSAGLDKLQEF